jgi:hypothetical protein
LVPMVLPATAIEPGTAASVPRAALMGVGEGAVAARSVLATPVVAVVAEAAVAARSVLVATEVAVVVEAAVVARAVPAATEAAAVLEGAAAPASWTQSATPIAIRASWICRPRWERRCPRLARP